MKTILALSVLCGALLGGSGCAEAMDPYDPLAEPVILALEAAPGSATGFESTDPGGGPLYGQVGAPDIGPFHDFTATKALGGLTAGGFPGDEGSVADEGPKPGEETGPGDHGMAGTGDLEPLRNDAEGEIGTPGFWCGQVTSVIEATGDGLFSRAQLEEWRSGLGDSSLVFPELVDAGSLEQARSILCGDDGRIPAAGGQLARHLLALWFNVTSRQVRPGTALDELCAGSVAIPAGADPEWKIKSVILGAEGDLLGGAEPDTLLFWKDVIDFIDSAEIAGAGPCMP